MRSRSWKSSAASTRSCNTTSSERTPLNLGRAEGRPHGAPPLRCLGRDPEIARLLELYRQGGRCALIVGAAGAGKTTFLEEVANRVVEEGGAVFRASARPASMAYQDFAAVADLAMAARDRGALLILEDLHCCDAPALALAARLADSVPLVLRGLVVFSSRTNVDLADDVVRIPLGPLDAAAVRQFFQSDQVIEHLLLQTGGDPRRLASLIAGVTRPRDLDGPAAAPRSAARHGAEHLLEALAVFARPVGPDHLLALAGGVGDLGALVVDLVAQGLLEKSVVDGELRVGHARGAVQQETYQALAPEHRRRLHAAVADLSDSVEERAHHLLLAEAGDAAGEAALEAGAQLEAAAEPERAISLYARALDQVGQDTLRDVLDERILFVLERTGEFARAAFHGERLLSRRPTDAALHRAVARAHLGDGRMDAADAALRAVEYACVERADLLLRRGDLPAAHAEAAAALELNSDALVARNVLGKVHLYRGELDAAEAHFARNAREAVAMGQAREEAGSLLNLGMVALERGRLDEARVRYDEGLRASARARDRLLAALLLQNLAVLAYRQGRYEEAAAGLHEAVDALKRLGHRGHLAWLALDLAFVYLERGQIDRAQQLRDFSSKLAQTSSLPASRESDLHLLDGRIAVARGRRDDAAACFDRALASAGAGTDRAADAALALADLALSADRPADVGRALDAAWPPPERLHGAFLARRGEAALALGRTADARSLLLRARVLSARAQDRAETARAARSLARACELLGRTAEAQRARESAADTTEARALESPLPPSPPSTPDVATTPVAARRPHAPPPTRGRLVGRHPRMLEVYEWLGKVARSDATVLIRGESGTGKELVAEAIHASSQRARHRIVRVNCGALVDTLLGSELFGHERGAFTGAYERHRGLIEAADGGTLFLDEIGDISPRAQATLLRVLQEREFARVGGTQPLRVDLRVVAATHANLERRVAEGAFREDLYFRLKGIEVVLPPLRERKEDIPALAVHFLAAIARDRGTPPIQVDADALELLMAHQWPGNVRELENVLRSVSVFAEGPTIRARDLVQYTELAHPTSTPRHAVVAAIPADPVAQILEQGVPLRDLQRRIEIDCITRSLHEAGGNIAAAARRLGMKRPRLSQLIKEHGIAVRRSC